MDQTTNKKLNFPGRLRRYFFTGLLIILPLYISIYVLYIIFRFVDGILGGFINVYLTRTLGFTIPGLGIVLFLFAIVLVGILGRLIAGKSLQRLLEGTVSSVPLLKYIYPSVRQVLELLLSDKHMAFKKAVLIEYPRKGSWSIGFIANEGFKEIKEKTGQDLLSVFVPLAPNPTSGFIVFVSRQEVIFLKMSINEAMKLVISDGLLNPADISAPCKEEEGEIR